MARELKERTGVGYETYGPGPVSDRVAALITNPAAWVEVDEPDTDDGDDIDLSKLTVAQLLALAEADGVDVPSGSRKADIIDLLVDDEDEDE